MRILFFGDIVGRPGRTRLCKQLPDLRTYWAPDFVIVEGENSAGGFGITRAIVEEFLDAGVDGITLGNHVFDQRNFERDIVQLPQVCRPINLACPGAPSLLLERGNLRLAVAVALGRTFMSPPPECPFRALDAWVEAHHDAVRLVEFHAETTAEKNALGYHLDGRVCGVFGTHTHVPTADARLLPQGTAYITDVGMCGAHPSVLGFTPAGAIARLTQYPPARLSVAEGEAQLDYAVLDVDPRTGTAYALQHQYAQHPMKREIY